MYSKKRKTASKRHKLSSQNVHVVRRVCAASDVGVHPPACEIFSSGECAWLGLYSRAISATANEIQRVSDGVLVARASWPLLTSQPVGATCRGWESSRWTSTPLNTITMTIRRNGGTQHSRVGQVNEPRRRLIFGSKVGDSTSPPECRRFARSFLHLLIVRRLYIFSSGDRSKKRKEKKNRGPCFREKP